MRLGWAVVLTLGCDVSRPAYQAAPAEPCPELPGELAIDIDCMAEHVVASVAQSGCEARLELATQLDSTPLPAGRSVVAVLDATLDASGAVTRATGVELGECTAAAGAAGSLGRLSCDRAGADCALTLYPPGPVIDREIETWPLVGGAPFVAPEIGGISLLDAYHPYEGHLSAGLVVGDVAWILSHVAGPVESRCREAGPSRLHRVPLADPTATTTVAAPRCLRALGPDPLDPRGFVGVTAGPRASIHRFSTDGSTIASARLPLQHRPGDADDVMARLVQPEGGRLVVVLTTKSHAWAVAVDAATLEVAAESMLLRAGLRAASLSRGTLYASDDEHSVRVLDALALSEKGELPIIGAPESHGESANLGELALLDGTHLAVTATGDHAAVWLIDLAAPIATPVQPYDHDSVPWDVELLPDGSRLLAVGLTRRSDLSAHLAFVSESERRFLPGTVPVGRGVLRFLGFDPRGRLWAFLPWSGELVAIGAAP